jgi:hypothetical protein
LLHIAVPPLPSSSEDIIHTYIHTYISVATHLEVPAVLHLMSIAYIHTYIHISYYTSRGARCAALAFIF